MAPPSDLNSASMFGPRYFLIGMLLCNSASVVDAGPIGDMSADKASCWGRVYTEDHLLALPQQTVRAIYLSDDKRQRSHFEEVELSEADAAAIGTSAGPPQKRLRLYVQPVSEARVRAADVVCTEQTKQLVCIGQDGIHHNDRPYAIRLTRQKASVQLDMLLDTWPLLTLEDHLSNPAGLAHTPLKATRSDRVFRLDLLPDHACAAVERHFAEPLASPTNPPLSKRIEAARQSGNRNQGRLCLTGQTPTMQLRLSFDALVGDYSFPIDEMSWRVEQRRISAPGQMAQSTLSCRVRDYAWRCESRQFDDQTRHAAIGFVEQTGMLMRRPGGAILRGLTCLGGRCAAGRPAGDNEDILLAWTPPAACAGVD